MGAFSVTENIGKQVTLLGFVPPGQEAHYDDGQYQGIFEGRTTGVWIVRGENLSRYFVDDTTIISRVAAVAPQHLLSLGTELMLVARKDHPAVHVIPGMA